MASAGTLRDAVGHQWEIRGISSDIYMDTRTTSERTQRRTGVGCTAVVSRTLVGHGHDYDQTAVVEIGGPHDGHVGHVIMVGKHAERAARIGRRNGVAARCRLRQATAEKRR